MNLQSCTELASMTSQNTSRPSCANRVIQRAFDLYDDAKNRLTLFFKEQDDSYLYEAYYTSWDSRNISMSVRKCWDRRVSHFNAMKNLSQMNNDLARVIKINLPDEDPGALIAIYRENYKNIMNNFP